MIPDDPRMSDEATGLPPLGDVDPENTLLVLAWDAAVGLCVSPATGHPEPVRFLSVRGLVRPQEEGAGPAQWSQLTIAVPVESCLDVAAALAKGSTEELGG